MTYEALTGELKAAAKCSFANTRLPGGACGSRQCGGWHRLRRCSRARPLPQGLRKLSALSNGYLSSSSTRSIQAVFS
ncbi:hypothetical protein C4Q27_05015 [Pseudomonas sp. SWI36]|nr:hypothetical protein C4Q27_05015 [Pseudomonas sp. SWI36]